MKENTRNLLVGLTVLVALAILAGMIIRFQELPGFLRLGYDVKVVFPEAGGASPGTDVFLAGKRVGRVAEIRFADDDPRQGVAMTLVIDRKVNIPGDANAYLRPRGLMGGTLVEFRADGQPPGCDRTDPATGRRLEWLPRDRSVTVYGRRGDLELIPPEVLSETRQTLASFRRLSERLEVLLVPPEATTAPARPGTGNIHATLARLDAALEDVHEVLGDPDNQANLKATLARLKEASTAAGEVMKAANHLIAKADLTFDGVNAATKSASARFDELAVRLIDQADRLGQVLSELNRAAAKINQGQGTLGKFVYDPELYNNMVDITVQMKDTINRLQELLELWKKQGMKVKL